MRPTWSRRSVAVALAAAAAVAGAGVVAQAAFEPLGGGGSSGSDNVAVAENTRDGSEVWALRLKVTRASGDVVDAGNAAVAVASCSDCQTVAVAIEGVLITGDPEVVAPVNLALAYNQDCAGCRTLAAAYQTVVGTDGLVRITGEGQREIAALRKDLQGLRTADLSFAQIIAEVDRIAAAFAAVLHTEVVAIGPGTATVGPSRTAEPTATPSEGGAQTGEPSPSPSVTAPASAVPSPSP